MRIAILLLLSFIFQVVDSYGQHFAPPVLVDPGDFSLIDAREADIDGDGSNEIYRLRPGLIITFDFDSINGHVIDTLEMPAVIGYTYSRQLADIDGDGDLDYFYGTGWYVNNGFGQFEENIEFDGLSGERVFIDFDFDGDLDIVVTSEYLIDLPPPYNVSWPHFGLSLFSNDGSGQFILTDSYESPIGEYWGETGVISSLVKTNYFSFGNNSDRLLFTKQFNWAGFADYGIYLMPFTADGFGIATSTYNQNYITENWRIARLDQNSMDDLVWTDDNLLYWSWNDTYPTASDVTSTEIGLVNFNDNDYQNIIYVSNTYLKVLMNLGDDTFELLQSIELPSLPGRIRELDLDNDSHSDLIVEVESEFYWLKNISGELGCIDEIACNFDPTANFDDGTCCYGICGCMNDLAVNFQSDADCEVGTCSFELTGIVFYDENENGIMDGAEYGLPFQNVVSEELGMSFITNDQGEFNADIGNEYIAEFELEENSVFPFNTTPNSLTFDASSATSTQLMFGVSNEVPDFAICIDLYPSGNGFLCNDHANHNICYRNMGNVPINGIIEVEYDELFQGHQEVTPIDSVNGNKVYMSFANLLPGEMFFYDIDLLTPTVDHIGEYITSYARAYGYYEGYEVAYGEQELTMEVTCAYDPNDKQAFPLGYTEEHWLLQETEQEFLVRFQNTGNAPAQDIRIQDTIDVNFDLSTFRMVANSHSVMATINEETRVVDFFFQDIQLPDSVNNEPDSHGLVSYKITPSVDLPVGTELNNTAYIYFDNNDAIVTNTTWTTIHECGGEAVFEASVLESCVEEDVIFTSAYGEIETYEWNINSVPSGAEEVYNEAFLEAGEHIVQFVAENPLCSASSMQMVTVYEKPSSEFEITSLEICLGDPLEFTSTGESVDSFSWILNNEEVSTEEEWSQYFFETGSFNITLNTQNEYCSDSESRTFEVQTPPSAEITENGAILIAAEGVSYQWLLYGEQIPNANSQTYEPLEDGTYSVIVVSENNCATQSEQVFIVNISEVDSPITLLYPNPMNDLAYLEFKDSSIRTIRMFDSAGREVRKWENTSTARLEILKAGLSSGNYVIQVMEGGEIFNVNLAVN